jgi:hypothetical protein
MSKVITPSLSIYSDTSVNRECSSHQSISILFHTGFSVQNATKHGSYVYNFCDTRDLVCPPTGKISSGLRYGDLRGQCYRLPWPIYQSDKRWQTSVFIDVQRRERGWSRGPWKFCKQTLYEHIIAIRISFTLQVMTNPKALSNILKFVWHLRLGMAQQIRTRRWNYKSWIILHIYTYTVTYTHIQNHNTNTCIWHADFLVQNLVVAKNLTSFAPYLPPSVFAKHSLFQVFMCTS